MNLQRACAKLDLRAGRYVLIPSTSGLKFKRRSEVPPGEAKLVKPGAKDAAVLTAGFKYALQFLLVTCAQIVTCGLVHALLMRPFRQALEEIFMMSDADANGSLSRTEFDAYMLRSDGQHVSDEDWSVLQTLDTVRKTPAGKRL